jgi:hypothetical protein
VPKAVPVLEKDWKNPRMNNENYEKEQELRVLGNLMSNAMNVTYVTNVSCEIGVSCASGVGQAYSIETLRLTSTGI